MQTEQEVTIPYHQQSVSSWRQAAEPRSEPQSWMPPEPCPRSGNGRAAGPSVCYRILLVGLASLPVSLRRCWRPYIRKATGRYYILLMVCDCQPGSQYVSIWSRGRRGKHAQPAEMDGPRPRTEAGSCGSQLGKTGRLVKRAVEDGHAAQEQQHQWKGFWSMDFTRSYIAVRVSWSPVIRTCHGLRHRIYFLPASPDRDWLR